MFLGVDTYVFTHISSGSTHLSLHRHWHPTQPTDGGEAPMADLSSEDGCDVYCGGGRAV